MSFEPINDIYDVYLYNKKIDKKGLKRINSIFNESSKVFSNLERQKQVDIKSIIAFYNQLNIPDFHKTICIHQAVKEIESVYDEKMLMQMIGVKILSEEPKSLTELVGKEVVNIEDDIIPANVVKILEIKCGLVSCQFYNGYIITGDFDLNEKKWVEAKIIYREEDSFGE